MYDAGLFPDGRTNEQADSRSWITSQIMQDIVHVLCSWQALNAHSQYQSLIRVLFVCLQCLNVNWKTCKDSTVNSLQRTKQASDPTWRLARGWCCVHQQRTSGFCWYLCTPSNDVQLLENDAGKHHGAAWMNQLTLKYSSWLVPCLHCISPWQLLSVTYCPQPSAWRVLSVYLGITLDNTCAQQWNWTTRVSDVWSKIHHLFKAHMQEEARGL